MGFLLFVFFNTGVLCGINYVKVLLTVKILSVLLLLKIYFLFSIFVSGLKRAMQLLKLKEKL